METVAVHKEPVVVVALTKRELEAAALETKRRCYKAVRLYKKICRKDHGQWEKRHRRMADRVVDVKRKMGCFLNFEEQLRHFEQ